MADIVSTLGTAYAILGFIVSSWQAYDASKEQLGVLINSTKQLLTTLNTEFRKSRLIPEKCEKPLEDLETLLRDIHRFVENEKDSGFLKMLFQKDARVFKIEAFHKRIGGCINSFQISSLLNIQTMLAESTKGQARDAEALNTYLSSLEKNNTKLLRTLEINQNNTIAMMVSLEKKLNNQSIERAEQKFYTHTLEYLTSRSGKPVKVEEWMIASFEVDYGEEIGVGGFGRVYRGTWNRTEVAIKVLQNEAGIKPSPASLLNEIEIWSTLRHPNIVQFFGANTLDDKPFIVMPYVQYNAKEFLRTRSEFDPLYILRDISLGLEYLHSRKICHGDLKAINVLVENSGRAQLCDFGLARLRADAASRTVTTGEAPQIQGSRNWMAPELLNGSRIRLPSDVYAFSMTLYELYTDEIPLFSVPYADLVDLVVRRGGRPEQPEEEDGGRPMPAQVWELAEHCWVADPRKRPTATQIHDRIKHMLSQLPPEPLNESTTVPSTSNQPQILPSRAAAPPPRPRRDEGTSPNTGDPSQPDELSSVLSDTAAQLEGVIAHDDHLDSFSLRQDWDLGADDFRRLEELQNNIISIREKTLGATHPDTLAAVLNLASTYHRMGKYALAASLQTRVIDMRKQVLGADHYDTLTAMCNLAATNRNLGRLEEAVALGKQVVICRTKALGRTNLKTLSAMHGVGLTYYQSQQYEIAQVVQRIVFDERKKILGKKHNDTLIAMECLAKTYHHLGRSDEARKLASKVLQRRKETLGKDHPHTLATSETLSMMSPNQA
ncbi:kinase-like domain-containing protein [Mycena capillaripes]|nr:kinase-like domain-containing protein [Mycena capillaripes]